MTKVRANIRQRVIVCLSSLSLFLPHLNYYVVNTCFIFVNGIADYNGRGNDMYRVQQKDKKLCASEDMVENCSYLQSSKQLKATHTQKIT